MELQFLFWLQEQVKVVRKKRREEASSSAQSDAAKPLIARQEALQKAKAKVGRAPTRHEWGFRPHERLLDAFSTDLMDGTLDFDLRSCFTTCFDACIQLE